ncbi:MAG: hypothetical protein GX130_00070, partial [Candidatus Hydrogenedens sp.]|nr:hypothetical protein [Candidatus Hydrogenedens sp.]
VYSNPYIQEYRLIKRWWPFVEPSRYEKREPGKEYRANLSVLTYKQLKSGIPSRKDITCLAFNQSNKNYNSRILNGLFSELSARLCHTCNIVLFTGCAPKPSDNEVDQVFRGVHTDFTLQQVTLLPQGIERATTPRRKMLDLFTHLKTEQFSRLQVRITRINLVVANGRMYLERSSYPKRASLNTKALKGKSLRLVHSNLHWRGKLVSTRNYVSANQVPFTRELQIGYRFDYSKDGGFRRVTAFFLMRKSSDSGPTGPWESISSSTKYKYNVAKADAHDWALKEYPFEQINKLDVRHLVAKAMADYSLGVNVSLSTIWYTNPECESDLSEEESVRLRRLMLSDVGTICEDSSPTYASILELICNTFPEDSVTSRRKYVSVLRNFMAAAVKRGLIKENPIEDLSQPENSILYQDPAFSETRSPLIKRHFTPQERRSALQEILGIEDEALRLACMARLTLGIDGNSLCALHWEDFRAVPVYNFCQFRIYRQVRNVSGYTSFENTGNIRGIPCPPLLAKDLMIRKAELKAFFKLTNKELDQYPLFVKTNSPDPGDQANFLSPREVSKALKRVVTSLDIPDEVFQIPDRVRGTVETNLSYYGSDIFREDFKYRATEHGRMIDGELRTMLGLTLMDTASKHYIDYERDDSQFAMYEKLVRMEHLLQVPLPARIFTEIEKHSEEAHIEESATPTENEIAAMEISVQQQRGLELEITITSQHGHNASLIRHQKRRK